MCKVDASPEFCATFYGYWCIGWGTALTIMHGFALSVAIFAMTLIPKDQPAYQYQEWTTWYEHEYGTVHQYTYTSKRNTTRADCAVLIALSSVCLILAISYIVAGALMCLGKKRGSLKMFNCGKILSYFAPLSHFGCLWLPIVHIFAMIKLSEYIKERWHK